MSKRGAPKVDKYEKYVSGKEETIRAACRTGATNEDLAKLLGCGCTTVKTILREYPQFKELVREGKQVADLAVENALFKRALGYDAEESYTEVRVNKDGSGTTTYVKKSKKHIPADVLAALSWLRNRKPVDWNVAYQKPDQNKETPEEDIDLSKLSTEELKQWEKLVSKVFKNANTK